MLYTLTMNLAIDLVIELDEILPNKVNRSNEDVVLPNGKGVNVSFILKKLNKNSTAIGFSGGFTGDFIEDSLNNEGIETYFIPVDGFTRINVFAKNLANKNEVALVNQGPNISEKQKERLLEYIRSIKKNDILTINGSLPKGIDASIFKEIMEISKKNHFDIIIDTSYKEVTEILKYQPLLLKPNIDELSEWFEVGIESKEEALPYVERLVHLGAKNVLLSLGGEGAIFMNKDTRLFASAPKGKVVNTACAGDTLLGTFIGYYLDSYSLKESLKYAVSAGSSTAFRQGLTDFQDVEELSKQVIVKNI